MRLHNPAVTVPYPARGDDGKLTRAYSTFRFTGDVDLRRVRRSVRRFLKQYGIYAPKYYIDHYIRLSQKQCAVQ